MTDEDLVSWFIEQLDAEEAVARAAMRGGNGEWRIADNADGLPREIRDEDGNLRVKWSWPLELAHIAAWDPARVLAEVAAKRRILELHSVSRGLCTLCGWDDGYAEEPVVHDPWPCDTVRLLAASCADQPGYRPEWAVGS